jgi:hypothetical protein
MMWLLACSTPQGTPGSVLLARHPELITSLSLPESSRGDLPLPERPVLDGPWSPETVEGRPAWSTPLPVRTVNYWHATTRKPPGMELFRDGTSLSYESRWRHKDGVITVLSAKEPTGLTFSYPTALEEEKALNRDSSELSDTDFALRTLPVSNGNRTGLFLPAPAEVSFAVEVPHKAILRTKARLLRPALNVGSSSDGATVMVLVNGREHKRMTVQNARDLEVDLGGYAGQTIDLTLRTEPGDDALLDYVFLSEPSLYTPSDAPPRVVFVFIDTLRRDHLGLHGYDRPTPTLDRLATEGLVFDQARAPAPWTLPSGRAALSGRHPDRFDPSAHLGHAFADQGWFSAAIVGNTYLTDNFDMADGWSVHRGNVGINAKRATDRAVRVIAEHADQPLAMVVHYMDPHLPYTEPMEHRLWARDDHETLGRVFQESDVTALLAAEPERRDEVMGYIRDRYDQNIRYVDTEVARLLESAGPNATTLVFSDHGEELGEHGLLGHGRGLSEELLRVPLIVHGPGIEPGRSDQPASLHDVLPTGLGAVGLATPEGVDGVDLRTVDDPDRPIAIGTPLFGPSALGVVHRGSKWVLQATTDHLYDLGADPTEDVDLAADADLAPFHAAFSSAFGRPLLRVLRVAAPTEGALLPGFRRIVLTGAIDALWPRPGASYSFNMPVPNDTGLTVVGNRAPAELFLQTEGVDLVEGDATLEWTLRPRHGTAQQGPLSDTVQEELRALGYQD